jgi:hypothetical protein
MASSKRRWYERAFNCEAEKELYKNHTRTKYETNNAENWRRSFREGVTQKCETVKCETVRKNHSKSFHRNLLCRINSVEALEIQHKHPLTLSIINCTSCANLTNEHVGNGNPSRHNVNSLNSQ